MTCTSFLRLRDRGSVGASFRCRAGMLVVGGFGRGGLLIVGSNGPGAGNVVVEDGRPCWEEVMSDGL